MAEAESPIAVHDGTAPVMLLYPRSVSSIPLLALKDAYPGEYEGEFFSDHPQSLARLINGEVDVLATGFVVGYKRHQSAGDIVHLLTAVWGVSALMTAEPMETIDDLAGSTVYAPFEGSPIDLYLKAVLQEAGLREDVEIEYAPFPQAAALLAQGKADAAVLVEPIASKVEMAGQAYRLENLEERSTAFSLMAERLRRIVDDINGRPGYYAERYDGDLRFPRPVLQKALENALFDAASRDETVVIIEQYTEALGMANPDPGFYAGIE